MSTLGDPKLVALAEPRSSAAEAFRVIQANLRFLGAVRELRRVLVTSAFPGEGKTLTAANLAAACAEAGHRVLLLDADLRYPGVHRLFGLPSSRGLTSVLAGDRALESVLYRVHDRLAVCPSGAMPPNPAELLGSPALTGMLQAAAGDFDLVVVDGPPCLLVADALLLSTQVDGVLLVVRAGQTRRRDAAKALERLGRAKARVLGVVLDRVRDATPRSRYGDAYGYRGRPAPPRGTGRGGPGSERADRRWAKPSWN